MKETGERSQEVFPGRFPRVRDWSTIHWGCGYLEQDPESQRFHVYAEPPIGIPSPSAWPEATPL